MCDVIPLSELDAKNGQKDKTAGFQLARRQSLENKAGLRTLPQCRRQCTQHSSECWHLVIDKTSSSAHKSHLPDTQQVCTRHCSRTLCVPVTRDLGLLELITLNHIILNWTDSGLKKLDWIELHCSELVPDGLECVELDCRWIILKWIQIRSTELDLMRLNWIRIKITYDLLILAHLTILQLTQGYIASHN